MVTPIDQDDHQPSASRSQLIDLTLAQLQRAEEEQLAAKGYHFYGCEAGEFAEASVKAVAEATDNAGWTK
jgi:hypothetical protein